LLPNLFVNYHLPDSNFSFGIGSYTPFGLATSYGPHSLTRYAAERSELRTIFVTPTIAWQPLEYLSLGAGISFVHSSGVLSRAIFFGPFGDGHLRITDTSNGYGYKFGLLLKPLKSIRLGLAYTSRVNVDFNGADVKFTDAPATGGSGFRTTASGVHLPLPQVVNFGIHWQLHPKWALEFEYDFFHWSEFKNLRGSFATPLPGLGGAAPIPGFFIPQNWRNSSTFRLAASHKLDENFEIRAGLGLDETPIPASTLGPAIPGADYLTIGTGVGYTWQRLKIDAGYMAVFYRTRRVNNNVLETGGDPNALPFPGAPGKDKYRIFQSLVGLHLGYKF